MQSTRSLRPHEALLYYLPPPPPPPMVIHPVKQLWSENEVSHLFIRPPKLLALENMETFVEEFTMNLRLCHNKRVKLTQPKSLVSSSNHDYLKDFILHRITCLFSEMRPWPTSHAIRSSTEVLGDGAFLSSASWNHYLSSTIGSSISMFHCPGSGLSARDLCSPIIVLFPPFSTDTIINPDLEASAMMLFLGHIWASNPECRIVCTDMKAVTVYRPTAAGNVFYDTADIRRNPLRLCVILAAYLHNGLVQSRFPLSIPAYAYGEPEDDTPAGPHIDPGAPLVQDDELFATCRRHGDFDFISLLADDERALQFLRWKSYIEHATPPLFARPGDVIPVATHGFFKTNTPLVPSDSIEDLPEDTLDHIHSHQRAEDPLGRRLLLSSSFLLVLGDELTAQAGATMSRTYRCRVLSVDGNEVAAGDSIEFCVKLLDDRFWSFGGPHSTPTDDVGVDLSTMRYNWETAEECVRREDAAYRKLTFLQGSLIPRYFGAHTFTLSDNHEVSGILMEYVPAEALSSGVARRLNTKQQIQLIESTRHAVRALQFSDVAQRDWHPGQILCHRSEGNRRHASESSVHCVLVDFSRTYQTYGEIAWNISVDDAGHALGTLLRDEVGIYEDLVWDHWAPREPWDVKTLHFSGPQGSYVAADPFEFVFGSSDS